VAGAAGAIHFIWKTKVPETKPYLYGAILLVLLAVRVVYSWRKRTAEVRKLGT